MADTQEALSLKSLWESVRSYLPSADIALPVGILSILMVLLVPMPTWLLDLSLSLSITFSVILLLVVIFVPSPTDLTSFPTILLVATMLRLALNVSSTRLILSNGSESQAAAGRVIQAFGSFVVRGNYVIGIIIFSILVVINFIVLTKGAGRIAEVAARFTLDSMPGKQMAIDADLSSGFITEETARSRREALGVEGAFFGSMDGASKFVRGDATAGIIITFINIIGGIIIGVVQNGMSLSVALHNYTILTVGDGLVSQIPALLVSTAAGILVTKSGISGNTQSVVIKQMTGYSGALFIASGFSLLLALIPSMPAWPFLMMALLSGGSGYIVHKDKAQQEASPPQEEAATQEEPQEDNLSQAMQIDMIRLELGYNLLELLSEKSPSKLTDLIKGLRKQLVTELGFIMSSVRIQDNMELPTNTYVIRIKEIEAARGDLQIGKLLLINPSGKPVEDIPGQQTKEPAFGIPALWINETENENAMFRGYTVVDPATVLVTHLTEVIKTYIKELFSYSETQTLLDDLPPQYKKLVEDVIPQKATLGAVQRILQNLLSEKISIRDLPTILEAMAEATNSTQNLTLITEYVRSRLARQICYAHMNNESVIPVCVLSASWEQKFSQYIQQGENGDALLTMPPSEVQTFVQATNTLFDQVSKDHGQSILLVNPEFRPTLRRIIERFRPQVTVLSQNEIYPTVHLHTVGKLT